MIAYESVVGLKVSSDKINPETKRLSAWVKDSVAGGFVIVAAKWSRYANLLSERLRDKSNHNEERLPGQAMSIMKSRKCLLS